MKKEKEFGWWFSLKLYKLICLYGQYLLLLKEDVDSQNIVVKFPSSADASNSLLKQIPADTSILSCIPSLV